MASHEPHEGAPADFSEVADKDRVEVARWFLEEFRFLDRSDAELANSGLYRFAGSLSHIPLSSRRALAKKAIAGACELSHDESQELAEYVREALPAFAGKGLSNEGRLLRNMITVLAIAKNQHVVKGEHQALLETVQEEVIAQVRENPVTVSAAFANLSKTERDDFVGKLITAGLLAPEHRAVTERILNPDTHGLLALVVFMYTFRWLFVIVPFIELFAWYDLPRTIECHSWLSFCDDPCTLSRWLFVDSLVWLLLVVAVVTLAGDCVLLLNQFRVDSVSMVLKLRAAAVMHDLDAQAKELGVDADVVRGARTGFIAVTSMLALAAVVAVWGVIASVLNLLSCRLVTFLVAVVFVGLRACMVAGAGFLAWHAYLAILTKGGGEGGESGGAPYGTFAAP